MTERVDLDGNATTPVARRVREAMAAAMCDGSRNPSSLHHGGRAAARRLSEARGHVARLLGARPSEVVFTSGGTEADRLGILGALAAAGDRRHAVVGAQEHPAVHDLVEMLADPKRPAPLDVTWVRPGPDGAVAGEAFASALRPDTAFAALMWASNETGVLQPVHDAARACRGHGIPLLVDAVQVAGKLPVDFAALDADLLAVSAHKMHGPMGAGALLIRHGARWKAPFPASHEGRRRAGTEPLPALVGFGEAARIAAECDPVAIATLRDRLERTLTGALGGVHVNGSAPRTPNTTNLRFDGIESDRFLALLDRAGIDASNGSACSSGTPDPSRALLAMGLSRRQALSSARFSLTRLTTGADIDRAVAAVIEIVETLRRG